jgi:hypothetical protein
MVKNRKAKFAAHFFYGLLLGLFFVFPVLADSHSAVLTVSTALKENAQATTRYDLKVTGLALGEVAQDLQFAISGSNPQNVRALLDDQSVTASVVDQQVVVSATDLPTDETNWTITIIYQSDLLQDFGASQGMILSTVTSSLPITSQTWTVRAPLDLGFATTRGVDPSVTRIGVGEQILTYTQSDGSLKLSPMILFGDTAMVTVEITETLTNDSFWWQEVGLTLPPDTAQQRVYLQSIEPQPKNIRLDPDGNMVALYRLGPKGSLTAKALVDIELTLAKFRLDSTNTSADTPPVIQDRYTALTDLWQPTNIEAPTTSDQSVVTVIDKVFQAIAEKAGASDESRSTIQLSGRDRVGSLRVSDWLVGELRDRGVAAREIIGLLGTDGTQLLSQPQPHAWVEAYIPGAGWTTLDPWLAQFTGTYAESDPLHIALSVWGIQDDRPPAPFQQAEIVYSDRSISTVEPAVALSIDAERQVWLPFLAITEVRARNSAPGQIIDNVGLRDMNGRVISLGSLAPGQTSLLRELAAGNQAFSDDGLYEVGLIGEDGSFEPFQETTVRLDFRPLGSLFILLILTLIIFWWRRRRRQQSGVAAGGFTPSSESMMLHYETAGEDIENHDLIGQFITDQRQLLSQLQRGRGPFTEPARATIEPMVQQGSVPLGRRSNPLVQ